MTISCFLVRSRSSRNSSYVSFSKRVKDIPERVVLYLFVRLLNQLARYTHVVPDHGCEVVHSLRFACFSGRYFV